MIFSYKWLQDYVEDKLPKPEKLATLFTFHSFEVEEVAKRKGEWVLNIDILPNRAHDCLSHIGVAREASALIDSTLVMPKVSVKENDKVSANNLLKVVVENKQDCPRYGARIMQGIQVGHSPKWIKERLIACGLQPINNIVDITNYVMLETGQPIHAFDADKVGNAIAVRRAKTGEKIKTLDDKEFILDKNVLVIASKREPIAIAGIKGGATTGIDKNTKSIIVEAANFNQAVVRKASQALKLRTDASIRFENGIDVSLIDQALNRVCHLIQKEEGGQVAKGMVNVGITQSPRRKIKLDLDYLNRLLGVEVPKASVISILNKLHFSLLEKKEKTLVVGVPAVRLDVEDPEDLIEEVGRVYGYQNIKSVFPKVAVIPSQRNSLLFWQDIIKDILKQAFYSELYNYSFIGDKDEAIFNFGSSIAEIENPVSALNRYIRPSLVPNMLSVIQENLKRFNEIKVFEIGRIAQKGKGIEEKNMLNIMLVSANQTDEGFYELKGVVETLLNKLGISDVSFDQEGATADDSLSTIWHPGKMAEIKIGGREVGFLGQIHPGIANGYGIKPKVFCLEVNLEKLINEANQENEYQEISAYPAVVRDLAVLVPLGTPLVEILNVINTTGGPLVRDVDVFDIYKGENIGNDKENFAFHIVYQSNDKTLLSSEVDKIQQKIITVIEENPSWEVRR